MIRLISESNFLFVIIMIKEMINIIMVIVNDDLLLIVFYSVAPTIMPFSFGSNLQEGMRASVTCTITTGDVPIDIQWLKNGQPLILTSDIHLEKVDDFISTLIFKPLRQDHSGIYSCVASNEASTNNHTIHLSVDCEYHHLHPSSQHLIPLILSSLLPHTFCFHMGR